MSVTSQNTRAVGGPPLRSGRIWNVWGSGLARTSLSCTRLKPSMADPSKVMPSAKAFSTSAGVILKDLGVPRTSVNQSWTKRIPRSSTVRSTYSCWRSTAAVSHPDPAIEPSSQSVHKADSGAKRPAGSVTGTTPTHPSRTPRELQG
jgi:hypothetical protein